ncbi:MAG: phycobilisome rod-core linker polypeptide [Leptolyngbyaceae cyanobacterium]
MAIPLLEYSYSTQNSRVPGYEVPGDDQARVWDTQMLLSDNDIDNLIEAAYRQIFFHAFESDREPFLESQLRSGQITVRDFIRGLLLSDTFNGSFYGMNSNYRFVEQCVQRVLGRDIYDEREKLAWSIVVATKGRAGFIDALLDSDEYLETFGDSIVPYQRRRVLPGRSEGELPFNLKSPRYNEYYRAKLGFPKLVFSIVPRKADDATKSWGSKAGDPSSYLNMVRSMGVLRTGVPETSAENVDFSFSKVPYRKKF